MISKHNLASLMARPQPRRIEKKRLSILVSLFATVQLVAVVLLNGPFARAENFSDPAFQQQWNATDKAVATGQVSRTYFWGPSPFAHTNEVYAESPNGGLRQVQYYDKARMELTKRPGQDPNFVTNGLLTVELVSGRLQVGDNQFLPRNPAPNPVAGDQVGNSNSPTYATYNQGKLAFGVPGATADPDRTGQAITEAVNKAGEVSTFGQAPVSLKYARYFGDTGHNLADVFYNFFLADPLGESKWLAVMGLPVSEPMWAKDKVVVAGQPKDVLIQLFQRRVLTYTPSNPAAYQVEMGNIGQHYYVWRYGFDIRDQLPGNYRAILPQDKTLFSVDLRQPASRLNLGETPNGQPITGLFALNEGRAVVASENNLYLADLSKSRPFQTVSLPGGLGKTTLISAVGSPDGQQVAMLINSDSPDKFIVQLYRLDTLPGDNLNVTGSSTLFQKDGKFSGLFPLKFSSDSRYLAFVEETYSNPTLTFQLHVIDLSNHTEKLVKLGEYNGYVNPGVDYNWLGRTDQLLYSIAGVKNQQTGTVAVLDAGTGASTGLLSGENIRQTLPSPDGNYFALSEFKKDRGDSYYGTSIISTITFRSLSNPSVVIGTSFDQNSPGSSSDAHLLSWSTDGTYLALDSRGAIHPGGASLDVSVLSLLTGQPLQASSLGSNYNSLHYFNLAGPFYTLDSWYNYQGPGKPIQCTVTIKNFDGSDKALVFDVPSNSDTEVARTPIRLAQVVQVPKV